MQFFQIVLSGAALISAAFAVEFNDVPSSFEPGKTYTITYSPKDNTPTTIKLRQGDPNNLATLSTITTSATGGTFSYTVPRDLPNSPSYALEISQAGSDPNYTGLIPLTGSTYSAISSLSSALSSATSKLSSASSAASSASASVTASTTMATTTSVGTASGAPSSSAGSNSTIASSSRVPSATSGSPSSPTDGSAPPQQSGNSAAFLASSPIAVILGAVAAMAYL
ncbi:unnamed protein product [Periconia digitata]|uniref:Yeast cell wall synthesis Kre9/Knh1-like N-terminal domain-containing protein n=1 Tax=Periconia digitata TaxID=1303443 RepID=A0A9W4XNF3_9PLEO|nr:unnamed protein product [Periconia digitata]